MQTSTDELIMLHSQILDADAEEDEDEEGNIDATAATLLLYGAEESRLARIQRRHPRRLYLCRPQLLPDPRVDTPFSKPGMSRGSSECTGLTDPTS